MDGPGARMPAAETHAIVRSAQVEHDRPDALDHLTAALGAGPMAMVAFFVTPETDFAAFMAEAAPRFPGAEVVGCTTAGEIGAHGYTEGEIVAVALPRANFRAGTILIEDLDRIDRQELVGQMIRLRRDLMAEAPGMAQDFAFLTVDGLSVKEDELVAALVGGLGPVPLFGGSAGDGVRYKQTFVAHAGRAMQNAAVLTYLRTYCQVKVFTLNNLTPTERRMVVTEADPARRIVRRINAEPAAREYARILGKDPEQLSTFTFAAHPVVVRFGGTHHVRSIQRVLDNGDLVFFSAIDEGLVLTLAEPADIVTHLARTLDGIVGDATPEAILACDCVLRRIEAQEGQKARAVSDVLARHRVVGFSTYGEQVGGMHVNQTMTGVALFAPEATA